MPLEVLLVGADYCISSEVEPAALEIRIEIWLFLAVSIGLRRNASYVQIDVGRLERAGYRR
jgi:hypothetical protein